MLGAQVGLKPEEVLDSSFDTLNAVIEGYQNKLYDQEILLLHNAFYTGYYSKSKKPKPLPVIIRALEKQRKKKNKKMSLSAPNIEQFEFLEKKRRGELLDG